MPLTFQCSCEQILQARDQDAGAVVQCPRCGKRLQVPSPTDLISAPGLVPAPGQILHPKPASAQTVLPAVPQGVNDPEYYLLEGTQRRGPFSRAQLPAAGLTSQTPIWKTGLSEWMPAAQLPELTELLRTLPPPVPPPAVSSPPAPEPRPWNPAAIAWLGLLFSPVWAGVMAALNHRRLCSKLPLWRPLVFGFGWLGLTVVLGLLFDSYLLDLLTYLTGVWLIWVCDLQPQHEQFKHPSAASVRPQGGWLWPSLAGVPLALLSILGFVVEPLQPALPQKVCDQFNRATTSKDMARHTTSNLSAALETFAKLPEGESFRRLELIGEEAAPAEVGGHLVGYRGRITFNGKTIPIQYLYHLTNPAGDWKIEEIYVVSLDRQPLDGWVPLSVHHTELQATSPRQLGATSSEKKPTGVRDTPSSKNNLLANRHLVWLLVVVAIGLGKVFTGRSK